jgi:hypothetical protein
MSSAKTENRVYDSRACWAGFCLRNLPWSKSRQVSFRRLQSPNIGSISRQELLPTGVGFQSGFYWIKISCFWIATSTSMIPEATSEKLRSAWILDYGSYENDLRMTWLTPWTTSNCNFDHDAWSLICSFCGYRCSVLIEKSGELTSLHAGHWYHVNLWAACFWWHSLETCSDSVSWSDMVLIYTGSNSPDFGRLKVG